MKKPPKTHAASKRPSDDLRNEYRFDYAKAQPNRFAERCRKEPPEYQTGDLGTEIVRLFAKVGLEFNIPELRGYKVKPVRFPKPKRIR